MNLRPLFILWCMGGAACGEEGETFTSGANDANAFAKAEAAPDGGGPTALRTQLATSPTHSCALREAGLFCWGQNFSGQLGTGDLVDSEAAVPAKVAGTDVVQVVAATARTCVRRSTGTVSCWGTNELGQRGDGTRDEPLTASTVAGVNDAVELAIDDMTSCVVRGAERAVSCWGGSRSDVAVPAPLKPVTIADLSGVVELRGGVNGEYCARLGDGSVRCWALKDDAWTAAVKVPVLAGARNIAMAAFAEVCGIVGPGPILCHNLENGKTVPLDDSAGHVRLVATGALAACAVNGAGTWHCWNILPPLLELVGSPRLDASAATPFLDFVFSGFRVCVLRPKNEVACGEIEDWKVPPLIRVEGLPD